MFPTPALDQALQLFFNQQLRSGVLDAVLPLFSSRAVLFALLSALLVWRSCMRGKTQAAYFLVLVAGMGLSDLGTNTVKHAVNRLRPEHSVAGTYYYEPGDWHSLQPGTWLRLPPDYAPDRERDVSFPSAHAANSAALVALAAALWPVLRRRYLGLTLALPVMVGWSRLYMGKHFPTDILGGWCLGLVMALLVWQVWKFAAPLLCLPRLAEPENRDGLRPM